MKVPASASIRHPAGTPSGGQFAETQRREADIELLPAASAPDASTPGARIDGLTADQHREQAALARQNAADSWDRSDTDGFVSQWASGINARVHDANARIAENGGTAEFAALADLDGNLVPAKLISTRYGMSWGVLSDPEDPHSSFTGWVNTSKSDDVAKQKAYLEKKGYKEVRVLAPAKATIIASGTGLSGAAGAYVGIRRSDGGFSRDVTVLPDEAVLPVRAAE